MSTAPTAAYSIGLKIILDNVPGTLGRFAVAVGGTLEDHDHEFEDVAWFPLAEAEALMSFPTERDIVTRAIAVAGLD